MPVLKAELVKYPVLEQGLDEGKCFLTDGIFMNMEAVMKAWDSLMLLVYTTIAIVIVNFNILIAFLLFRSLQIFADCLQQKVDCGDFFKLQKVN